MHAFFDEDYPAGELRYYWKSLYLDDLVDEAIDRIVEHTQRRPSPLSTVDVWHMDGAISRVGAEESAILRRAGGPWRPARPPCRRCAPPRVPLQT
jgi:hypothetical protein